MRAWPFCVGQPTLPILFKGVSQMTTTAAVFLDTAREYLGVTGQSPRHHQMVERYNQVMPLPRGYRVADDDDWCDVFISFLAIQTGATDIIGRECGVERHVDKFKKMGIWYEDGTITPKPGDLIVFDWDQSHQPNDGFSDHIGIVESVSGGKINTIEGNSSNAVKRRHYPVGYGYIRGYARPRYASENSSSAYNNGSLSNAGYELSQNNIQLFIDYANKYGIKPSFMITQAFVETHWGDRNTSLTGSVDNNWVGISEPFRAPKHLNINISRGTMRKEGGYYVRFQSMKDFMNAYGYILSPANGLYKVAGATTIETFCKGLFRSQGASADFAASGYEHYYKLLIPTYNALKRQNPGKLEKIDGSSYHIPTPLPSPALGFNRIPETGVFYPNQTVNVRKLPSRSAQVIAQYYKGENVYYDSYVVNDGHIWLSYVSFSGTRHYVAWRVKGGEKFGYIGDSNSGNGENQADFYRVAENGMFYPNQTVNVRNYPGRSGSVTAQYHKGESLNYDSYVVNDGHVWLSYVSFTGVRQYVAWHVQGGEKFGTIV